MSEKIVGRIGLIADIHEEHAILRRIIEMLRSQKVDSMIVLGDIADRGRKMRETVAVLQGEGVNKGVYGNHDWKWRSPHAAQHFDEKVTPYIEGLDLSLSVHSCHFRHGPITWGDPADIDGPFFRGGKPDFDAELSHKKGRITFMGHFHKNLLFNAHRKTWDGDEPISLTVHTPCIAVIAAAREGYCAVFDTDTDTLHPYRVQSD